MPILNEKEFVDELIAELVRLDSIGKAECEKCGWTGDIVSGMSLFDCPQCSHPACDECGGLFHLLEPALRLKDFAISMGVHRVTVIGWIKRGLIPGAVMEPDVYGTQCWIIPASALDMERPKRGARLGSKRKPRLRRK